MSMKHMCTVPTETGSHLEAELQMVESCHHWVLKIKPCPLEEMPVDRIIRHLSRILRFLLAFP